MSDSDHRFIAEALPAFIAEAREQVDGIEQLLLRLEDAPDDRELLDALFRCAHTVKGSAGIFGLDDVVAFTHHVETLLDRLREGRLALSAELSTLLLRCNDQILQLVDAAGQGAVATDTAEREALVQALHAAGGAPSAAVAATTPLTAAAATATAGGRWHVSAHFGVDTFRNGMDPGAILAYLGGMGRVVAIACDLDAVPPLDAIDPESCHLGFDFGFESNASREQIESAFSFVQDDLQLKLVEPGAGPDAFIALIDALPEQPRLGEMLVAVGAITRAQLDAGLQRQAAVQTAGVATPRIGDILQQQAGVAPTVVDAALDKQQQQRQQAPAAADDQRLIRVQADRLDAVINLVGELVIASAGASLLAGQSGQAALVEANAQIGRLVEEIRNGALQMRMVPIGETFARFRRVVRDTAADLGKEVVLEVVGGDTELDKSVVERIADPLMHLVRNALDHGLETPDERQRAGKPAQGRLTLAACHEAGNILIRISDDGRGIRRDKVLQRAWERGMVPQGSVPPDDELLKLIFAAGFSTADKVTNLSGRGVGMDVVRRNIEALRGSVELSSDEGAGSCIAIRLPLTLAIIDGFLVGVGTSKFIFPLDAVVEVIESRPTASAQDDHGRSLVELRGQVLPLISLRRLYGLDCPAPERSSVVVIQAAGRRYGVVVDVLLGQHQTVIKPLGRMFRSLRGMSGASILGSGDVALIFDAASLAQMAADATTPPRRPDAFSSSPNAHARPLEGQTP